MKMRSAVPVLIVVLLASFWVHAQVRDYRPVTEAMLRNPAAGDWLNWRRTDNAWGYSPLDQINRQNVGQLQLAWSWAMDDTGAQEATPLVHDGIMYLPNPRGVIQALDGATGDLIWEYRPEVERPRPRASAARGGGEQTDIPRSPAARAAQPPEAATRSAASSETSRSSATRSSAPPTTRTSSRSTRGRGSSSGTRGRRSEAGVRLHVRPDRRSREGDRGDHRMHPLQGRRLLHHRSRRGHRQGAVAHVDHRAPGRARRRHVGRPAADSSARAATRGFPAATIRTPTWSTGARRRPSRGREPSAAPTATRSTRTRRSRSIPTPGR